VRAHHEHEFEAAPGLPAPLPVGERILWQGAPQWRALCVHVFHLRKLAAYFAFMLVLQTLYLLGEPGASLFGSLGTSVMLALTCLGMLALIAWFSARGTLYTLTTRRLVMRIGIVLTITLNLPLKQIRGASLLPRKAGQGDIALALAGSDRIGWLHLWPHARPWFLRDPQPTLRCIPDVDQVAALIQSTWQTVNAGVPAVYGTASADAANDASAKPGQSNRPATA
jgi:hypothetical protein